MEWVAKGQLQSNGGDSKKTNKAETETGIPSGEIYIIASKKERGTNKQKNSIEWALFPKSIKEHVLFRKRR